MQKFSIIFLLQQHFKMENIDKYTKLMYRLFFFFGVFPVQNPFGSSASSLRFSWRSPSALISSFIVIINFYTNIDFFINYDEVKKLKATISMAIILSGIVLGFLVSDTIFRLSSLFNCPSFVKLLQIFDKLQTPSMLTESEVTKLKNGAQSRKNTVTVFKEKSCQQILTLISILLCITLLRLISLIHADFVYLTTLDKSPYSLLSVDNNFYTICFVWILSEISVIASSIFYSAFLPVILILNLFHYFEIVFTEYENNLEEIFYDDLGSSRKIRSPKIFYKLDKTFRKFVLLRRAFYKFDEVVGVISLLVVILSSALLAFLFYRRAASLAELEFSWSQFASLATLAVSSSSQVFVLVNLIFAGEGLHKLVRVKG